MTKITLVAWTPFARGLAGHKQWIVTAGGHGTPHRPGSWPLTRHLQLHYLRTFLLPDLLLAPPPSSSVTDVTGGFGTRSHLTSTSCNRCDRLYDAIFCGGPHDSSCSFSGTCRYGINRTICYSGDVGESFVASIKSSHRLLIDALQVNRASTQRHLPVHVEALCCLKRLLLFTDIQPLLHRYICILLVFRFLRDYLWR